LTNASQPENCRRNIRAFADAPLQHLGAEHCTSTTLSNRMVTESPLVEDPGQPSLSKHSAKKLLLAVKFLAYSATT
jgi:hypothetical protein